MRFIGRIWPLTTRGTGALALAVGSFAVAHYFGLVQLLYFGVLLTALIVAAVVSLLLTRRASSVTRTITPDLCAVGRPSTVNLRVGVRTLLPTSPGEWSDVVPGGLSGIAVGSFPALGSTLGGRGQNAVADLSYPITGRTRGVHALGPLEVTVTDPFALARRRWVLGGTTPVTVAPAIVDLPSPFRGGGETGGMLLNSLVHPGQGADDIVARPYAPGDSMRRVHWRATARRDTLMVRQEEQESNPVATVVLDRGERRWSVDATRAPGRDAAFETAVSAAVSVCALLARAGYAVSLIDSDGELLADPIAAGEEAHIDAAAVDLATVTTRPGDDLPFLSRALSTGHAGPLVVVTGALEDDDVTRISPLAHHSAMPVLLAASPRRGVLQRLGEGGWYAAAAPGGTDLTRVWRTAFAREVSHVGA